jgi:paraquat-inducible protein A
MERSKPVPTFSQETARKFDRPPRLTAQLIPHPPTGLSGSGAFAPAESRLKACRACDATQALPAPRHGYDRKCRRCGETMGSGLVYLDLALPILLAGLVGFIIVLALPLIQIELQGQHAEAGLMTGAFGFMHYGMAPMALFAFACVVFAPLGRVIALLFAITCVRMDWRPRSLARIYRLAESLRPWGMLDVFLVGSLISMTKLHDLVRVEMAPGLWVLMGLVWSLALFDAIFDRHRLWDYIAAPIDIRPDADAISCLHCNMLQEPAAHCRRCGAGLHRRKPESVQITWALILSAVILYIPANLYPVFTIVSFGRGNTSTIIGGVRQLLTGSDWVLAIIIFVASIVVPLIKLIGLAWLLIAVRYPQRRLLRANTKLHRAIESIGRWSATDVFVAALLSGLVMLDNLATVVPGPGVLAFGAVVFLTMVATMTFDQRLLWDAAEMKDE